MKVRLLMTAGLTAALALGAGPFGCARSERNASADGIDQSREQPRESRPMLVTGRDGRAFEETTYQPRHRPEMDGRLPMSAGVGATTVEEQRSRVTAVMAEAPPLTLIATPPYEPRNGEFWVAGHWRPDGDDYVWEPGRIEQDRPGRLFVPANLVQTERGWEYTPEYWR